MTIRVKSAYKIRNISKMNTMLIKLSQNFRKSKGVAKPDPSLRTGSVLFEFRLQLQHQTECVIRTEFKERKKYLKFINRFKEDSYKSMSDFPAFFENEELSHGRLPKLKIQSLP